MKAHMIGYIFIGRPINARSAPRNIQTRESKPSMATDMTSALREFAFKKLQEAKQKGATLANASAATASATLADTAASLSKLSSSAPVASAGGFTLRTHSPSAPPQPSAVPTREQHLRKLRTDGYIAAEVSSSSWTDLLIVCSGGANSDVRTAVAASSSAALSESVYKMDLINESLAFTIENIQVP